MSNDFVKGLKTFTWSTGHFAVITILGYIADNLASLGLNPEIVLIISAVISFITAAITKWWAKKQATLGKTFFGRIK